MKIGQVTINGVLFNINVTYYDDTGAAIKGNCALNDNQLACVQNLLAASVSHTSSGKDLRTYKEIKLNDTGTIYGSDTTPHSGDKVDVNTAQMTIQQVWDETKTLLLRAYDAESEPVLPPSMTPEVSLRRGRRDSISSTQSSSSYVSTSDAPAARRDSASTTDTDDDEEDEQVPLLTPQQLIPPTEAERIRSELQRERLTEKVITAAIADRTDEEKYYKDLTQACFIEAPTWEDVPRWLNIVKTVQNLNSKKLFDALKAHMLTITITDPPKKKEPSWFWFSEKVKVYPSRTADWVRMWNSHFRDHQIDEDNL